MQTQVIFAFNSTAEYEEWLQFQATAMTGPTFPVHPDTPPLTEPIAEPPKPTRRKRRTKKQIEADDAERAEAAVAEVARAEARDAAADASTETPEEVTGSITPVPDAREYTLQDAVPILRAYIATNGSPAVIAKLKEYGAKRINEVAPERLDEFLTELVAAS